MLSGCRTDYQQCSLSQACSPASLSMISIVKFAQLLFIPRCLFHSVFGFLAASYTPFNRSPEFIYILYSLAGP